jgi:hypothetical protein
MKSCIFIEINGLREEESIFLLDNRTNVLYAVSHGKETNHTKRRKADQASLKLLEMTRIKICEA